MRLTDLYHWMYCLPLPRALLLWGGCCAVFLMLRSCWRERNWWQWLCGAGVIFWAAVVVHMTLLTRSPDPEVARYLGLFESYRIWLQEGNREMLRSILMNFGMFLPGGLLLIQLIPGKWPRWKRLAAALLPVVLFSAAIEWTQFSRMLGQAEMDDVLHNALGAALGILADLYAPTKNHGS